MFHRCNLAVQTFSNLSVVSRFKNFMQSLYGYFFESSKKHLELTKLAHIMETKGNKDHAKCENMLNLHVITFEASFLRVSTTFDENGFGFNHCQCAFGLIINLL